jgi:hypothetical protein
VYFQKVRRRFHYTKIEIFANITYTEDASGNKKLVSIRLKERRKPRGEAEEVNDLGQCAVE